jgi:uncharacterized protein
VKAVAIGRVAHLVRHPIKSAGYENVDRADLSIGEAFPFDRRWAVAHAAARLADPLVWAEKLQFLRGWASSELMAIACVSEPEARAVTLSHPRRPTTRFRPDDPADAARLIDWLRPLWPDNRPEPAEVISIPGQALTDMQAPLIAMNSVASLKDLGHRMGSDLSMHRFRGNIWVDGWAAWAERDLVGAEIKLGGATLRVEQQIARCRAIGANPETGVQDADALGALSDFYGHDNFGVYATVIKGGTVAVGDEVVG